MCADRRSGEPYRCAQGAPLAPPPLTLAHVQSLPAAATAAAAVALAADASQTSPPQTPPQSQAAISGNEPSDAVRVVNALLTQLDGLKRYKNALVITTSNLTGAIDAAFVDRADIKQYIGPPGVGARYDILVSCLNELSRAGLLAPFEQLLAYEQLVPLLPTPPPTFELLRTLTVGPGGAQAPRHSMMLNALAVKCGGLSGRALRKLPFLAHATLGGSFEGGLKLEPYLEALHAAIDLEGAVRQELSGGDS